MNAPLFPVLPSRAHAHSPAGSPPRCWGAEVRRILCVRLDNLGDVLMTTPAISALKHGAPGRHLTLLASAPGAAVARFVDDIDDVICHDASWMKNAQSQSQSPIDDFRLLQVLRDGRFDAAVIFTVYSQNPLPAAMMCRLAGIPRCLAHCRENPYALLSDWVPEIEPAEGTRHEVERQLDLVRHVGARTADKRLRLCIPDGDRRSLDALLAVRGIEPGTPRFVLHAGVSAPSRCYPAERFGEVAARLARDTQWPVLVTGGSSERETVAHVVRAAGPAALPYLHDLAGALSLGELAALIASAAVLVSNNSGPVHIAAALGTPVVVLYALTNPQHTPWQTASRVLFHDVECRWCYRSVCPHGHHACLLGVAADDVASAALELRAAVPPPVSASSSVSAPP